MNQIHKSVCFRVTHLRNGEKYGKTLVLIAGFYFITNSLGYKQGSKIFRDYFSDTGIIGQCEKFY